MSFRLSRFFCLLAFCALTLSASAAFENRSVQQGVEETKARPAPPANSAWLSLLSCGIAAGLVLHHRSKFQRK